MSKYYELFIDELGQANPISKQSEVYVLSGCTVEESQRDLLKIQADQIKFKYWGHTDVVFHSREIARNEGSFSIFNKNKSKKKETSNLIFLHFVTWLLGIANAKGKINIESATAEKDRYYLNTFSYFLSPGNKQIDINYKTIQELLTSISFVTKINHDTEEQLADLFAYAAKCKYLRLIKKQTFKIGTYEDKIIKLLDSKLWHLPQLAKEKKMRFYKNIEPFCIIPKT